MTVPSHGSASDDRPGRGPPADPSRYAIAIDLGTTGLKVGLVSFVGDVVWHDHAACATTSFAGGGREQDAEQWWSTISRMIRTALSAGIVGAEQVAVVACTGQWASTVPVDADGTPVGPCIMWSDTRGGQYVRDRIGGPVNGYSPVALSRWIRRSGGVPAVNGRGPTGQHLHLINDRPDIARDARWFLEPVDYLTMRFTGIAAATHASMTASWLTDVRRLDVMAYDRDLVAWSGIDPGMLPPLVRTSSIVGPVRPDVATALGLPPGTPVVTGLPDIATAGAGAGAVQDGEAHLAISTTSWISCPAAGKKTNLRKEIAATPGPVHGGYLVANNIDTAGACLDWFRRVVSLDGTAGLADVDIGTLIDLAAAVPAGSRGVVFTPWLSGAQGGITDASARGGFHNIRLGTGAAELSRAILEGVAVQNAMLLGVVERFVGRRLDPIRIIGGGARSDLWCQIHADALGRTIERPVAPLAAGLRGAALNAAVAIGALLVAQMGDRVTVERTFRPDAAHRELYDGLAGGFRRLHRGQRRGLALVNRSARR